MKTPTPSTAPSGTLVVEEELSWSCTGGSSDVARALELANDGNAVVVLAFVLELRGELAAKVAGALDVEMVLPYWSAVEFVMLKNVLKATGLVPFVLNNWKLNWLSFAMSNFEPPSLPSIVTFQLYDCCVSATRVQLANSLRVREENEARTWIWQII
jgi:hypothetical protein